MRPIWEEKKGALVLDSVPGERGTEIPDLSKYKTSLTPEFQDGFNFKGK